MRRPRDLPERWRVCAGQLGARNDRQRHSRRTSAAVVHGLMGDEDFTGLSRPGRRDTRAGVEPVGPPWRVSGHHGEISPRPLGEGREQDVAELLGHLQQTFVPAGLCGPAVDLVDLVAASSVVSNGSAAGYAAAAASAFQSAHSPSPPVAAGSSRWACVASGWRGVRPLAVLRPGRAGRRRWGTRGRAAGRGGARCR